MPNRNPKELVGIVLQPIELGTDLLKRRLGLFSVVIISLSAMLGSGLFVLPALAMLELGSGEPLGGIWLAYLIAAVVVLPSAISKAELATAMPVSGGSYLYVQRTFGPLIGTISGLGLWANFMLKSAFALIGFKAYLWVLEDILGTNLNIEYAALVLLLVIVWINILGVKKIKSVQVPIVLISTSFLIFLCIFAIFTAPMNWDRVLSSDAFGSDWTTLAETSAFVFVSYAGVTKIAAVGGEVKNPDNNLPYGILLSLAFSSALYVFVTIILAAAVDPQEYMIVVDGEIQRAGEDPIYVFANAIAGENVGRIAALLAIATMTSMALAGIMASSRFPFAMARDNLLPEFMEDVHSKYETPHYAIIVTGLAMALAITFLPVKDVAKLASGFKIMIFIVINLCVIILRRSSASHGWYNPSWKSPAYPLFQVFGIFAGTILLILMGEKALIGGGAAVILGFVIFKSYGERHISPKITPWETFRLMFRDPDEVEKRRRLTAFHAADTEGTNHLTLHEFIAAMEALDCCDEGNDALRSYFHAADTDEDGVIDIDQFLESVEQHGEV